MGKTFILNDFLIKEKGERYFCLWKIDIK